MIEPNETFEIELAGRMIKAACLTRSKQRKILGVLKQLQTLEESVDSVQKVYDLADELIALCVPSMPESERELLSNQDAFDIATKVLTAHTMGTETKKKSESPPSSDRATYAKVAVPDVVATSWM